MAGVAAEFFLGAWQDEVQFSLMWLLEPPTSVQQLRQITTSPFNPDERNCPGLVVIPAVVAVGYVSTNRAPTLPGYSYINFCERGSALI